MRAENAVPPAAVQPGGHESPDASAASAASRNFGRLQGRAARWVRLTAEVCGSDDLQLVVDGTSQGGAEPDVALDGADHIGGRQDYAAVWLRWQTRVLGACCERLISGLLQARRDVDELQAALVTNRDISVAIGILMARHLLAREQALDALRVVSQHRNVKLREVARGVIDAGELAGWSPADTKTVQRTPLLLARKTPGSATHSQTRRHRLDVHVTPSACHSVSAVKLT